VTDTLLVIVGLLAAAGFITGILVLLRLRGGAGSRDVQERTLREQLALAREDGAAQARQLREELRLNREEGAGQARQLREEVSKAQERAGEARQIAEKKKQQRTKAGAKTAAPRPGRAATGVKPRRPAASERARPAPQKAKS